MTPDYLRGRGGQLSPHHHCNRTGPDRLGSLPVWDSAGFGSRWTGAEARARTRGQGSPPLLAADHIQGGATSRGPCRARCPWLVERVGSENGGKGQVTDEKETERLVGNRLKFHNHVDLYKRT